MDWILDLPLTPGCEFPRHHQDDELHFFNIYKPSFATGILGGLHIQLIL